MKEKPILFSGPMVCAILEGRKTQTRRVVKCPHLRFMGSEGGEDDPDAWDPGYVGPDAEAIALSELASPFWGVDRLWVKETFSVPFKGAFQWVYRADGQQPFRKWTPAIYMPRAFSRITLKVDSVDIERLQQISMEDCRCEGADPNYKEYDEDCVKCKGVHFGEKWHYKHIWDSINAKRGLGWDTNPWVWVIRFSPVKHPSDS